MTTRPQAVTAVTAVTAGAARRRARAVSVLGVLCLLLALAPAARADSGGRAAPAPSPPCSPGWLCGWTGPAYTGVASLVAQDMPRFPETTAYVGFNDAASVWNAGRTWTADGVRRGRCVTVYNKPDYAGSRLTVKPGQGIPQLAESFGHVRSSRFHTCRLS
ncbi:peptidase inhibitor family I36 protein [Streptomyces erythrochromogenes]|uniref:peptidase inhibitor family I36 protein n=1 Tax=Streptomyces erythrochromogenes TaxID=285574 RepID=UPI0038675FE3|nr:peptidase inhibitor family I36 protein [Streptomyces erythrochromogenes]